jgi:hypothetical protein
MLLALRGVNENYLRKNWPQNEARFVAILSGDLLGNHLSSVIKLVNISDYILK